jgi:hypothetical protein
MTRVACLMMQKDEDLLLRPWLCVRRLLWGTRGNAAGAHREQVPCDQSRLRGITTLISRACTILGGANLWADSAAKVKIALR